MKRWMFFSILAALFLYGCVDVPDNFCAVASDCDRLQPTIDCVGAWQCIGNGCEFICTQEPDDPYLLLTATPSIGEVPLEVSLQADLFNSEGHERELYCVGTTWDFGEGDKLMMIPGCLPYDEAMQQDDFMELSYMEKYTYTKPGTYEVSFSLDKFRSNTVIVTVLGEDALSCKVDSDCVPAQCCHPDAVVNKKYAPNCADVACTLSCEGPLDCGAGHPACDSGKCVIVEDNPL